MTGVEWSVVASDDEWTDYDPKSDVVDTKNIPVRIALLFKEIEKNNGVLPIICNCPRVGVSADATLPVPTLPPTTTAITPTTISEGDRGNEAKAASLNKTAESSKIYEAFEFDDESDAAPAAALRKTPGSGVKRANNKKEKANLSNVVNDIRRQKLLDDMEAAASKPEPASTVAEDETKKTS